MCWKESQAVVEKFHHCGAANPCIPEATLGLNGVAVLNLVTTLSHCGRSLRSVSEVPRFAMTRGEKPCESYNMARVAVYVRLLTTRTTSQESST